MFSMEVARNGSRQLDPARSSALYDCNSHCPPDSLGVVQHPASADIFVMRIDLHSRSPCAIVRSRATSSGDTRDRRRHRTIGHSTIGRAIVIAPDLCGMRATHRCSRLHTRREGLDSRAISLVIAMPFLVVAMRFDHESVIAPGIAVVRDFLS